MGRSMVMYEPTYLRSFWFELFSVEIQKTTCVHELRAPTLADNNHVPFQLNILRSKIVHKPARYCKLSRNISIQLKLMDPVYGSQCFFFAYYTWTLIWSVAIIWSVTRQAFQRLVVAMGFILRPAKAVERLIEALLGISVESVIQLHAFTLLIWFQVPLFELLLEDATSENWMGE